MSDGGAGPALRGRVRERATLDRLLAGMRAGQGQVIVVRGEAGVGKTALLDHVQGQAAAGCRVVRAAGVEAEGELAFAGLHQLCTPLLGEVGRLPEPQRTALGVAFGLDGGTPPDRFLVGLARLGLLSAAADEGPLICVVDDVQWLDRASLQALGFAARRLLAEPVALVFGVFEPSDEQVLAGLPELPVRGLGDEDAGALLDSVVPGRLDERVRARIIAETRGNPLALLELPIRPGGGPGRWWPRRPSWARRRPRARRRCSPRRTCARSTSSTGPGWSACGRRSRSPATGAATRRRCCSRRRGVSNRSTAHWPGRRTSTPWARRSSPAG